MWPGMLSPCRLLEVNEVNKVSEYDEFGCGGEDLPAIMMLCDMCSPMRCT